MKIALGDAGLKAEEMAEHLGVSRQTLTRWMNDHGTPPRRAYLLQWAAITDVNPKWLETGEGGGATPPPRSPRKRGAIPAADSPEMAALANRSRRGHASTSEYLLPTAA